MASPGERRRPVTPSIVLGCAALALAVLVAAVALDARQQSPPALAEFAPQAVEQIKKALDSTQSEAPPSGPGSAATPSPTPAATHGPVPTGPGHTPSTAPIVVPRVRQCVGDPPRQTEDPQSPPCVAYFDPKIDNGGATAPGVTRDEITIAMPVQFLEDTSVPPKLVDFFNKRYEFYGRKLVLKTYQPAGCSGGPQPAAMRDDAVAVKEQLQAFASLGYCNAQGADQHYYDALAEQHVISSVDGNLARGVEAAYAAHAPYEWNVQAGTDSILAETAQLVCADLAGRPPKYAGTTVSAATRKFGLIYTRAQDGTAPDVTPLEQGLKACGVTLTEVREDVTSDPSRNGVNAIVTMHNAGVTTLMCLCSITDTRGVYMPAASGQGYQPEWLETSYGGNDLDNSYSGGNAPPDQTGHILGLTFRNKLLPKQDMPWYWAVREADPTSDPAGNVYYAADSRYLQLLLLASGIQLAGPHLTPATFQAALERAAFPNPGAEGPPYYQALVGFPGPRHVMSADASLFWYDPNRQGTIDPTTPGSICYVDRGRRYALGTLHRADPPFFSGPCL